EEGTHILTINSIEGIKVKSIEWINKKNGKQDFIIDLKDYAAGIYYIVLTSPMKVISKKLVVIK
ncbi:MAG: hypothetical protein HW421_3956, partial [Ignavibacteria bacterium]|nr:hypothetical protein [Ignavibacteria bacterium]